MFVIVCICSSVVFTCNFMFQKYDGSFVNCIKECNQSAEKLMKLIVENFPSMRDEAEYCGKKGSPPAGNI